MNNIKKGWLTTLIGALMMVASLAIALGFYHPEREVSNVTLTTVFVVGAGFLFIPQTVEERLRKLIKGDK